MSQMPRPQAALNLKYPQSVAIFATYAEAQHAVDYLSDKRFPVENLSIVGTDLKSVERVLGRKTWGSVLAQGAVSGIGTGLLVGVMMMLFMGGNTPLFGVLAAGLAIGIITGMGFAALGYLVSGGKRDFNSIQQVVATRYEVLGEHNVADKARELLMQLPGARAAEFN